MTDGTFDKLTVNTLCVLNGQTGGTTLQQAYDNGDGSITLDNLKPFALDPVEIGIGALSANTTAIALGRTAVSDQYNAVAIGTTSTVSASAPHGIAIGAQTVVNQPRGIAIGTTSVSLGANSLSLGHGSTVNFDNTLAIGYDNICDGPNSICLGNSIYGTTDSIIIGSNIPSTNVGVGAIMLGNYTNTTTSSIAIGENALATDGVITGSIENNITGSIAIGSLSTAHKISVAIGTSSYADTLSVAVGAAAKAFTSSTAIGPGAECIGFQNIAIGSSPSAQSNASIAIGSNAYVYTGSNNAICMGNGSNITNGLHSMSFGTNIQSIGNNSICLGNAIYGVTESIIIGSDPLYNTARGNVISIGYSVASVTGSVTIGHNLTNSHTNTAAIRGKSLVIQDGDTEYGNAVPSANTRICPSIITTTNDTVTGLFRYVIPDNGIVHVEAMIQGSTGTGGSNIHYYCHKAALVGKDAANPATVRYSNTIYENTGGGAWATAIGVEGNDLVVNVTGLAATTVHWNGSITITENGFA